MRRRVQARPPPFLSFTLLSVLSASVLPWRCPSRTCPRALPNSLTPSFTSAAAKWLRFPKGLVWRRWYGGVQLGPDRFKHINNVARALLAAHGYVGAAEAAGEHGRRRR